MGRQFLEKMSDLSEDQGIDQKILDNINYRIGRGEEVHFTQLQKQAINAEGFWAGPQREKNLIVQGATSGGKTLIAELLAMQTVTGGSGKNVIFLVPLKALVTEKYRQLSQDSRGGKYDIRVYASSADHQDNDYEISRGNFEIAVIVYEKFFALLAQENHMLDRCGLIVVDEMQLLSSSDRGPKLEYALTKVKLNHPDIRFLGLLATGYDTEIVERWLDAQIILNEKRPVGLLERIISVSGKYWENIVLGENDIAEDGAEPDTVEKEAVRGEVPVVSEESSRNLSENEKRIILLCSILKKSFEENAKGKAIIFVNAKERCKKIAREICEHGILPNQNSIRGELIAEIERLDEDEDRDLLMNKLIPYGVAYHTAALPSTLRDLIEEEFRKEDGIVRVIVATETLTIGMNLPVDMMILFDTKVNRGAGKSEPMKPQDYKNYIGRAGRLGLTSSKGVSYFFSDSETRFQYDWKKYVLAKETGVIRSAFWDIESKKSELEKACAPYFLNLLNVGEDNKRYDSSSIDMLKAETLSGYDKEAKKAVAEEIIKLMRDHCHLLADDDGGDFSWLDMEDGMDDKVMLTDLGKALAPYALSLETSAIIYHSFFNDACRRGEKGVIKGGLPFAYTAEDLERHHYILDILYRICEMKEADRIYITRFIDTAKPTDRDRYYVLCDAIRGYLKTYRDQFPGQNEIYWEKSPFLAFTEKSDDAENTDTRIVIRMLKAIALYEWMKGVRVRDIKKKLFKGYKIENPINGFALQNLGEVTSHLLEAVSSALISDRRYRGQKEKFDSCRTMDGKTEGGRRTFQSDRLNRAFYNLSRCARYGLMDSHLLDIAKCSVYGIGRNTILDLGRQSIKEGFSDVNDYLYSDSQSLYGILSPTQLESLRNALNSKYKDNDIDVILAKFKTSDPMISADLEDSLRQISSHSGDDDDWFEGFNDIWMLCGSAKKLVKDKSVHYRGWRMLSEKGSTKAIMIAVDNSVRPYIAQEVLSEVGKEEYDRTIVILRNTQNCTEMEEDIRTINVVAFCKILINIVSEEKNSQTDIYIDYLLRQPAGLISFKGMQDIRKEMESVKGNRQRPDPLQQYLAEKGFVLDSKFPGCSGGTSEVYRAYRGEDRIALKVVKIPCDEQHYKSLWNKAAECQAKAEEMGCSIGNREGILEFLSKNDLRDGLEEEDIDRIWDFLKADFDAVSKELYFIQFAGALEAVRQYRSCLRMYKLGKDCNYIIPITNIHDIKIEKVSYRSPDSRDNDAPHCQFWIFLPMLAMDGNLKGAGIPSDVLCEIGIKLCEALGICHKENLIHRDVKPENILYARKTGNRSDMVYLGDFGALGSYRTSNMTIIGTKSYMAPEVEAGHYDMRCDIYSLGMTLKEIRSKRSAKAQKDELDELLEKAYRQSPDERYSTMEEFKQALESYRMKRFHSGDA